METEASNGDVTESFKENEGDGEKKSSEEGEKPKIKAQEEGTNGSCLIHTTLFRVEFTWLSKLYYSCCSIGMHNLCQSRLFSLI